MAVRWGCWDACPSILVAIVHVVVVVAIVPYPSRRTKFPLVPQILHWDQRYPQNRVCRRTVVSVVLAAEEDEYRKVMHFHDDGVVFCELVDGE